MQCVECCRISALTPLPPLMPRPQVSSLDGDGRALVKMAVSGGTSSLPEGALQLVTKKDYKRNSRVISMY